MSEWRRLNEEREFTTIEGSLSSRSLVLPLIFKHAYRRSADPVRIASAQIFPPNKLNFFFPRFDKQTNEPDLNCRSWLLIQMGDDTRKQTKIKHAEKNSDLWENGNTCTK